MLAPQSSSSKHGRKRKPQPKPGQYVVVAGSSKNKLGGDDRFPTKRDFKKWEANQQEERQRRSDSDSGEDDDVRVDGVGRRGGRAPAHRAARASKSEWGATPWWRGWRQQKQRVH